MVRVSRVGLASVLALAGLSVLAWTAGLVKLLGISWVAFAAMAIGAWFGQRNAGESSGLVLVWGYGLASGAMIASTAVFLLPNAIAGGFPAQGGFGIALGVILGFAAHTIGHRITHHSIPFHHTAIELSAHALSAGLIIGVIYTGMPELGPLLGLAIVSHKGPAGYAAASRLTRNADDYTILLLPAAGVGLTGLLVGLLQVPSDPVVNAVVFGFAAGVLLHVAMDFLPRCELGGEIYEVVSLSGDAHHVLDKLRIQAVLSTSFGGLAVFLAWLAVT